MVSTLERYEVKNRFQSSLFSNSTCTATARGLSVTGVAGGMVVEGWIYSLFAVGRLVSKSPGAMPAVAGAVAAVGLCTLNQVDP
jgi:hypothetical protein